MAQKSIFDLKPGDIATDSGDEETSQAGGGTGDGITDPQKAFAREIRAVERTPADPGTFAGAGADADPAAPHGYKADGTPYKRRPGKRRSAASAAKNSTPVTESIAKGVYSIHMLLATFYNAKEWQISQSEAQQIADGLQAVQDAYGVELSPKQAAMVELIMALGGVYGPRIAATVIKRRMTGGAPQTPGNANADNVKEPEQGQTSTSEPAKQTLTSKEPPTPSQLYGTAGGAEGAESGAGF